MIARWPHNCDTVYRITPDGDAVAVCHYLTFFDDQGRLCRHAQPVPAKIYMGQVQDPNSWDVPGMDDE